MVSRLFSWILRVIFVIFQKIAFGDFLSQYTRYDDSPLDIVTGCPDLDNRIYGRLPHPLLHEQSAAAAFGERLSEKIP